ncbi:MAG: phosphotransferase [Paracoccaceae bacterium]|nr:phosphotransferase [Paracoccaceae bacterium]MDG2259548.1 phosphotransferase [Paracoccaceae bacterium]
MNARNENLDPDVLKIAQNLCDAAMVEASVEMILRNLPNRHAILAGTYQGQPAIFRLALSDKARATNAKTWAEITRVGPYMADGQYRVAQGLKNIDDGMLIVTEFSDGDPLLPMLKKGGSANAELLAGWLHKYATPTIEMRKAGVDFWLKQARNASQRQPFSHLKAKEDQILIEMQSIAAKIRGSHWRVAITHGDYHANNLLSSDDTVTGIDIGGSAYLPIYKDMARCLVHLARRDAGLESGLVFGVDKSLTQAFLTIFSLQTEEQRLFLRFFIGFECLIKVERTDAPKWRLKATEALYDGFLLDTINA